MDGPAGRCGCAAGAGAPATRSFAEALDFSQGLPGLADGSREWIQVFEGAMLGTASFIFAISEAVPVLGNKVVAAVRVVNTSNAHVTRLVLEGSYDGEAWEYVGETLWGQLPPGYFTLTPADPISHAFVRVTLVGLGGMQYGRYDAWVAFSSQ